MNLDSALWLFPFHFASFWEPIAEYQTILTLHFTNMMNSLAVILYAKELLPWYVFKSLKKKKVWGNTYLRK